MGSVNRLGIARALLLAVVGVVGARALAQQNAPPAPVRTDISGEWIASPAFAQVGFEDVPHYLPGPELGDYTGLPINAAARQKAEAWDATILSQPERQTQAHPVQYRNGSARRILKVLDPVTQQVIAFTIAGHFGRADQIVWLDGRPHPSDYSEHTWDGFSTGVWEDGVLVVTTTHMKMGVIRRNGTPASPYGKLVERYFRHGPVMTVFSRLEDPMYLEEPYVRTYSWTLDLTANTVRVAPFEAVDELADKPLGWVPFFPLGLKQTEFAGAHGLPFEVTRGGAETMYPEYQLKIQQLMKGEAAQKAVEQARGGPRLVPGPR